MKKEEPEQILIAYGFTGNIYQIGDKAYVQDNRSGILYRAESKDYLIKKGK